MRQNTHTINYLKTSLILVNIIISSLAFNGIGAITEATPFYTEITVNNYLNQFSRGGYISDDPTLPGTYLDSGGGADDSFLIRPGSEWGGRPQLIFILIGINNYDRESLKELKGAWADVVLWTYWASALYETLDDHRVHPDMTFYIFGDTEDIYHQPLMIDTPDIPQTTEDNNQQRGEFRWFYYKATKTKILEVISEVVEKVYNRACVYFVFSGHGGSTADGKYQGINLMDDPSRTDDDLKDIELQNAFKNYAMIDGEVESTNYLYYFFDSCHGGGMEESADIYAKTQVAFFAPCQEDEVTNETNVEDFVGHKFPDDQGIHGLLTMSFMEQFWDQENDKWDDDALYNKYLELCYNDPNNDRDILDLITTFTTPEDTTLNNPVFIDGNPQEGCYFYTWWNC